MNIKIDASSDEGFAFLVALWLIFLIVIFLIVMAWNG